MVGQGRDLCGPRSEVARRQRSTSQGPTVHGTWTRSSGHLASSFQAGAGRSDMRARCRKAALQMRAAARLSSSRRPTACGQLQSLAKCGLPASHRVISVPVTPTGQPAAHEQSHLARGHLGSCVGPAREWRIRCSPDVASDCCAGTRQRRRSAAGALLHDSRESASSAANCRSLGSRWPGIDL